MEYKYFTEAELSCHCKNLECDGGEMKPSFMERLIKLREELGFAFPISSAYRCYAHNKSIGGAKDSLHLKGQAVDIRVSRDQAYQIVERARRFGFRGIGVSQKGNSRFVHLDNRDQRDVSFWSY